MCHILSQWRNRETKIIIIIGSFLAVFLLLMMPNVRTVEYNQGTTSIEEKISVLTEKINRLLERVKEENIISLNKLAKNENGSIVLDEITTTLDSFCFSWAEDTPTLKCFLWFILFVYYVVILCICLIFIWVPGVTLIERIAATHVLWALSSAQVLGCAWASGVDVR